MSLTCLAADLGGTRLKLGVLRDGRILARRTLPADAGAGLATHLTLLKDLWRQLLHGIGLQLTEVAGVAVAFPSLMDPVSGRVLTHFGKYPDAPNLDLRAWADRELKLPLAIDNDARLALVGEWQHGAGRGCDDLVMVTLGTGIGTAVVAEGRLLRGGHGQAGILGGHSTLDPHGERCVCGNLGCAETLASTLSLPKQVRSLPESAPSRLPLEPVLDFAAVFRLAAHGDAGARLVLDRTLRVWGCVVVNLIHAYDPERVLLAGGLMRSAHLILPALQSHVDRHARTPWGQVRLAAAELGDDAALHAADWVLRNQFPDRFS